MTKRSYHQHCALARALDLVGERWTLLLVRELLTGPRRYKDLLSGVPNMGTNLLAARLRDLVAADIAQHDGTHYSLTDRGHELEPAVLALARFGASLLTQRKPKDLWLANWNVVALKYAFRPEHAKNLKGVLELHVEDSRVQANITNGAVETSATNPWSPTAKLITDADTFLALASGQVDLSKAESNGDLQVEGNRPFLRKALAAFAPSP